MSPRYVVRPRDGHLAIVDKLTKQYALFNHSAEEVAERLNDGRISKRSYVWRKPVNPEGEVSTALAARIAKGDTVPRQALVRKLARNYLQEIGRRKRAEGQK